MPSKTLFSLMLGSCIFYIIYKGPLLDHLFFWIRSLNKLAYVVLYLALTGFRFFLWRKLLILPSKFSQAPIKKNNLLKNATRALTISGVWRDMKTFKKSKIFAFLLRFGWAKMSLRGVGRPFDTHSNCNLHISNTSFFYDNSG